MISSKSMIKVVSLALLLFPFQILWLSHFGHYVSMASTFSNGRVTISKNVEKRSERWVYTSYSFKSSLHLRRVNLYCCQLGSWKQWSQVPWMYVNASNGNQIIFRETIIQLHRPQKFCQTQRFRGKIREIADYYKSNWNLTKKISWNPFEIRRTSERCR